MNRPSPFRLVSSLALALTLAVSGLMPSSARAGTAQIDCYSVAYDVDADGYASNLAPLEPKTVDEDKKLYCPAGYVPKKGDCDDTRADVHPRAPEIAFNLRNDDCDKLASGLERTDEPELVYFPNGNLNTKTSFSIRVRLASFDLLALGSLLAYEVEYADLAASGLPAVTAKRRVGTLPSDYAFDAPVTGLQPARVYRARLNFYKASTPPPVLGAPPLRGTTTYTSLGVSSEWYYSATEGDGQLEATRTDLLLDGFYQLSESDRGRVGYRGTAKPDGTRYGAAAKERWCSEFYTWLGSARYWTMGAATTVSGVITWFQLNGSYYPGTAAILSYAKRADYIPVDTDSDPAPNHSTMFLAYDATTGKVWTLEGNFGNTVAVYQRSLDSHLKGVGRLPSSDLIAGGLF